MRSWPPKERVPTRNAPACAASRGVCTTLSVGGMRAVLGHWASDGLPLPQATAPSAVARVVILFGPEPHCQGSGSFVLGEGVGRRNGRSQRWVRTPHQKICHHFQEFKDTSLIFLVGKCCELRLNGVLRSSA
jgi:hypothetical protein